MDHLYRTIAPITERAWEVIDAEAESTLAATLAGRRLFDVTEPLGWSTSAIDRGRAKALTKVPQKGAVAAVREVQRLVEVRVPFEVEREELDAIARGAKDPRLDSVGEAARKAALFEDSVCLNGYADADITGAAQRDAALKLPADLRALPDTAAEAIAALQGDNVGGPYALALEPKAYESLQSATANGYPVAKHVTRLVDAPIVRAPALDGGIVTSLRGGDFELCLGADFAVGYTGHSASTVELYIEELFTFVVNAPEACVTLA